MTFIFYIIFIKMMCIVLKDMDSKKNILFYKFVN